MGNANLIKILGYVATVGGVVATLLSDWVDEKKMDEKIDKCVDKKFAELNGTKDEES